MNNNNAMTDKNGVEIVPGVFVKRTGFVTYADGPRYKVSKQTWLVSRVEDNTLFYADEAGNDVKLGQKEGIEFLVVGDAERGLQDEYKPSESVAVVNAGSVEEKYRVLKDVKDRGWKKGDVVSIVGKVSQETLEGGWLEKVDKDTPNKHVLVVVDPIIKNKTVNYG